MKRRGFLAGLFVTLVTLIATGIGCGGSGDSTDNTSGGGAPNDTTRARTEAVHGQMFRSLTNIGYQNQNQAMTANGIRYNGPVPGGGHDNGGGVAEGNTPPPNASEGRPFLAAFLRNIANVRPHERAGAVGSATRAAKRRTRQQTEPGRPIDGDDGDGGFYSDPIPPREYPFEYEYFDFYLGLHVKVREEAARVVYSLFEDAAFTVPAGNITTEQPADWNVFPQVFRSSYEFTRGYLAGSRGTSNSTSTEAGLYTSAYENIYSDGARDSGQSVFTPRGDSTWTSRTDFPNNGGYEESRGTFRADGSGGTHREGSDGFVADYTFQSDGSGQGRISGPLPGLPATIAWDAYGATTIRYADGTTVRIPGWGYAGGGGGTGGTTGHGGGDGGEPVPQPAPVNG